MNSSRAVWPISFFSASGSSTPGTSTRMRLPPSVMTVISLVPPGSMRRRTTSRATPIASFSACAVPLGVGVRTIARRIDDLHVPVAIAGERDRLGELAHPLDRGVDLGRIADHEGQPPAGGRNVADVDARVAAQLGRNRILHRLEPLLLRVALNRPRAAGGCRRQGRGRG